VSLFIAIEVDPALAGDRALAKRLVEVCPVDIYAQGAAGALVIQDTQLDECTLCELCLAVGAPGQVVVRKLYDGGRALERSAPLPRGTHR
jgi:hypothetical protein